MQAFATDTDVTSGLLSARTLEFASDVARQGRDFGVGVPILYWIAWLFVAYFLVYFVTTFVGPALWNTRPFYWGRPYGGRNSYMPRYPPLPANGGGPNFIMRHTRGIAHMDEGAATELTARVTRAI